MIESRYRDRIISRLDAQRDKGLEKYGQILEQNPAGIEERLEHLAQELTDGLEYIEWIKEHVTVYSFPKIKFADTATLEQQLRHVSSELYEVEVAYVDNDIPHLVEELFDLQQSCDTALRVIARLYPAMDLAEAKQAMIQKNINRGYCDASEIG